MFSRNPVFAPLLAIVAGMTAELFLPGQPWQYWPALLLAPAIGWAYRNSQRRARQAATLAFCFFGGGWWLSLHPLPSPPEANIAPGERAEVQGCIVSAIRRMPEQTRFLLELNSGHRMQVSIYPRPHETVLPLHYGQWVTLQARVRPPRNFRNQGGFDYERYLLRKRVFWLAAATGVSSLRVEASGCGNPALAWLHRIRGRLLDRLAGQFEAGSFAGAYFAAILFGEDQGLSEQTVEDFRRAGVYHTLVISGQHIAILAAACLLVFQLLPVPRWARFLLTAILCWSYALLSGYETPALRAACGITLYLTGSLAYRRVRPVNLLSVVALVFLVFDPGMILDTGFQLSFAAVLIIAGIAAPLQHHFFGHWPRVARNLSDSAADLRLPPTVAQARVELRLVAQTMALASGVAPRICRASLSALTLCAATVASLLLISVVVQVGLSPVLIASFHRAPLLGPLANLILSPLLGLLAPLAFLQLGLDVHWLANILGAGATLTGLLTSLLASATPDTRIPGPPSWLLVCCALSVLCAIAASEPLLARPPRAPRPKPIHPKAPGVPPSPHHPLASLPRGALFAVILAVWLLLYLHPFAPRYEHGALELTMVDVGQGESLLLVTPRGRTVLIDTGGLGGFSSSARMDTGEDIVGPLLWSRGIRRIDILVLTHFDFDHAGGAIALLRAFRPNALWTPGPAGEHLLGQRILAEAAHLKIPVHYKLGGDREAIDGVEIQVLHPTVWQAPRERTNHSSMVLFLRYGGSTALMMGDLERSGELRLLADGHVPRADLLKVAHHGSRSSTIEPFVNEVQPSLALISAGWLNPFGHPHPSVVERLERHGVAIWQTGRDGAITLQSDGLRWRRAWLSR